MEASKATLSDGFANFVVRQFQINIIDYIGSRFHCNLLTAGRSPVSGQ
jgi:hypothetical protein